MEDAFRCASRNPKSLGCCCCSILLLVTIFCSFGSLEINQLGLNYSLISSTVEKNGYSAGLYPLGPFHSFIKFPSTVQTIQFSNDRDSSGPPLRSRTSDGLELTLEISFQYQLNTSVLSDLYHKFGTEYEKVYVNMAMDLVTSMATRYSATSFFSDRPTIARNMEDALKEHFDTAAFAEVPFFQLRAVSLPQKFEDAIQVTEVQKQDIETAAREQKNVNVTMQTKVLQAEQHAQAIALAANASAQGILLHAEAYVQQFNVSQRLQAESFKPLYEKLGNNESLLLDYLRARAMRDHPDHLSIVGMANS